MKDTGYYLEVIRGIDSGKTYDLTDGAITIGRSYDNTIQLNENELSVSNHHAIFYNHNGKFLIQDMASKNGLFLNGVRTIEEEVVLNDLIGFGEKGPKLKLLSSNDSKPEEEFSHQFPLILSDKNLCEKYITTENPPEFLKTNSDSYSNRHSSFDKNCSAINIKKEPNNSTDVISQRSVIQKEKKNKGRKSLLYSAIKDRLENRSYVFFFVIIIILFPLSAISFFSFRFFQHNCSLNMGIALKKKISNYEDQTRNSKIIDTSFYEVTSVPDDFMDSQYTPAITDLNNFNFHQFIQDTVELFLKNILTNLGNTDYYIPPQMIETVKKHLRSYSTVMKPTVSRFLKKKEIYFPMIKKIFSEKNIPVQLAYISMLESGFNPLALSSTGARGLWQLMPQTGRKYGLKIDSISDERTEPQKSTYAAAEYLKDLIGIFGGKNSIMLAIAAYNAGENKIIDALKKMEDPIRDRDFWYIYRMDYLAKETNEYIPGILALMIIDQNRAYFNFSDQEMDPSRACPEGAFHFGEEQLTGK